MNLWWSRAKQSCRVFPPTITFLRCVRSARTARARLPCRPKWSGERPQDRQNNRRILRVSKRRERVMRRTVTPCVLVLFTLRLAGWAAAQAPAPAQERGARTRSEERRVGKECRARCAREHVKKVKRERQ